MNILRLNLSDFPMTEIGRHPTNGISYKLNLATGYAKASISHNGSNFIVCLGGGTESEPIFRINQTFATELEAKLFLKFYIVSCELDEERIRGV